MIATNFGLKNWYNEIAKLWGEITDDNGKKVRSYKLAEMPENVSQVPCALTFLSGEVSAAPSIGGPLIVTYNGKTEFHLTLSLLRSQLPYVMSFVDKILQKAASDMTLGGKVVSFRLWNPGSVKPVQLTWGNEGEHYGLEVPWVVIENQSGKYTVSA